MGGSLLYYIDKSSFDIDIDSLSRDVTNYTTRLIRSFGLIDDKPIKESNNNTAKPKMKSGVVPINLNISKEYTMLYSDIELCTPDSEKTNSSFSSIIVEGYDKSYSCVDNKCSISIYTKSENIYPRYIEIYEKDKDGNCTKRRVSAEIPIMSGYSALLKFTPQLLKRLDISGDNYQITTQKSQDIDIQDIDGIKKIKLSYDRIIMADLLIIDGKERALLKFKEVVANENIDPREELKLLQDQIERLKAKKVELEKRLSDNG
jgi:hypothetical protein